MITVKKADGTSVHMTMAEFQAYKGGVPTPRPTTPHHGRTPTKKSASAKPIPPPPPAAEKPIVEAPPFQPIAREASRHPVVAEILAQFPAKIAPEHLDRLETLVLSRVKDVRTDDQFLSQAMTPTDRGGLGLSPDSANTLLELVRGAMPKVTSTPAQPKSAVETVLQPRVSASRPIPAPPKPTAAPAPAAPKPAPKPMMPPTPAKPVNIFNTAPRPMPPSDRPMVQDVAPQSTSKRSMGPVEELGAFTLTDFRRLAPTTDAALSRLKEKFKSLSEESFLLFMQAREAWYHSPLYLAYVDILIRSLGERTPIPALLSTVKAPDLTLDVFQAVAQLQATIA